MTKQDPDEFAFEKAFERLEAIVEILNSGKASLEESLALYEEADKLIIKCNKKLVEAERKIESLVKNRQGQINLGPDQKPQVQDFNPS